MESMNEWWNDIAKDVTKDVLVSFVSGTIGFLAGKATEAKMGKEARRQRELDRESVQVNASQRRIDNSIEWRVNPYWVCLDGDRPKINGYEELHLLNPGLSFDEHMSLYDGTEAPPHSISFSQVLNARSRNHWLIFEEKDTSGQLILKATTEPSDKDEAHLFQPLPPKR
jgi:hypothetical protein